MELYRYKPNPDVENVYGISPVEDPANEQMFIYMNKEHIELRKVNLEKRLVTGVVLIPNQRIVRLNKQTGNEYEIFFDEEGIRFLSNNFLKNGNQHNAWENHLSNKKIKGLTYVENWIVEDSEMDKSRALGMGPFPVGTWMTTAYVENDELWDKIKKGVYKGFSIDSFLSFEKIEMSINKNNNKIKKEKNMSFLKKLINLFAEEKEVKLGSVMTEEYGTLTYDSLEVGSIVYNEMMEPMANCSFMVEGVEYSTDENGAIKGNESEPAEEDEYKKDDYKKEEDEYANQLKLEKEEGEVESNEDVELSSVESNEEVEGEIELSSVESNEEVDNVVELKLAKESLETLVEEQKLSIENYTTQLSNVIKENEELKLKVQELSKQPATTKLKSNEVSLKATESTLEAIARINASRK